MKLTQKARKTGGRAPATRGRGKPKGEVAPAAISVVKTSAEADWSFPKSTRQKLAAICSAPDFISSLERAAGEYVAFRKVEGVLPRVGAARRKLKSVQNAVVGLQLALSDLGIVSVHLRNTARRELLLSRKGAGGNRPETPSIVILDPLDVPKATQDILARLTWEIAATLDRLKPEPGGAPFSGARRLLVQDVAEALLRANVKLSTYYRGPFVETLGAVLEAAGELISEVRTLAREYLKQRKATAK